MAREVRNSPARRLLELLLTPLSLLLPALAAISFLAGETKGAMVIRLSAGDMIPADARVLDARDLFVKQAALTGEAMPVEKIATCADGGATTPIEYPNLCFMGSNVSPSSPAAWR